MEIVDIAQRFDDPDWQGAAAADIIQLGKRLVDFFRESGGSFEYTPSSSPLVIRIVIVHASHPAHNMIHALTLAAEHQLIEESVPW